MQVPFSSRITAARTIKAPAVVGRCTLW